MKPTFLLTPLALIGLLFASGLQAQTDKMVSKQEKAKKAFAEVTDRMQKLQVKLADTDPDKSRILGIATKFIQEKRIQQRMDAIKEELSEENWDEALDGCSAVVKDLDKLIDLLLKGDDRLEELIKEIERLEAFKKRVDKLIKDQQKEKEESAKAEALQKHLKSIRKAKKKVADLMRDQKDLREDTNKKAFSADADQNKKSADKEKDLKSRTDDLAKDLDKIEKKDQGLKDSEGGDGKAGEAKEPKDGGSGEGGEGQGGDGQGSGQGGKGGASKAAQSAAQNMDGAQNKLQDNKPQSSLENMDKALNDLQKTKDELDKMEEEANRELRSLPFEQMAKKQNQTRIETDRLAKDMEKSDSQQGDQGDGNGPTPGKQNVQQAVPKQKAAAGQLKDHKPSKAKQDQQDAKEDLEEAKRALDEALAQLRQELQDEVLRSLEERFGEMLTKQKKLTAATKMAHRLRNESLTADGSMSASLKERVNKLALGEFELKAMADDAVKLLEEEGTTAVFPELVSELAGDLKRVGRRLQKHKTGKATQSAQKEIEDMLKNLIEALRQTLEQKDSDGEP